MFEDSKVRNEIIIFIEGWNIISTKVCYMHSFTDTTRFIIWPKASSKMVNLFWESY